MAYVHSAMEVSFQVDEWGEYGEDGDHLASCMSMNHTNTTMCGSLNFQELHQGYLSGVKLLRAFSDFIGNDECTWCLGGLFSFLKCVIDG